MMKEMKNVLVAGLFAAVAPNVFAATLYTNEVDGVKWVYSVSDGKATLGGGSWWSSSSRAIVGYIPNEIAIPDSLSGYPVTSVDAYAFYNCTNLISVTIPNSVTYICEGAFRYCSGLTSINIPDSVTSIGDEAFYGCRGLADENGFVIVKGMLDDYFGYGGDVVIPDGVRRIGSRVFDGFEGLSSVRIPDGVTSIGDQAFSYSGLKSVAIPDSVEWVGLEAFSGCSFLTNVVIGKGLEGISYDGNRGAFEGCSALESFEVSEDNQYFKSVSGLLLNKEGTMLVVGVNGDVIIPDGVTDVEIFAFYGRTGLTSLTIPESVEYIGWDVFGDCTNLLNVTVSQYVLDEGLSSVFEYADVVNSITNVTILPSANDISPNAFKGCRGLVSVSIPNSVTNFGTSAFDDCSSLTSVRFKSFETLLCLGCLDKVFPGGVLVIVDDLPEGIQVHSKVILQNETWTADKVHLVMASVTVPSGFTLTIESGTVVKFLDGTKLTVETGGICIAEGVTFTSIADDSIGGDTMGDGDATTPEHGSYAIAGEIQDDENTRYKYIDRIALRIADVSFRQRYPWNGLVDIDFTVKCGVPTNIDIVVSAKDEATGKMLTVQNVWLENDATHTNALVVQRGTHRLVWDAHADMGQVIYNSVVVRVACGDAHEKVQLWEDGPYWATTNIGAENPEEYGYYFWWGDTIGYKHESNAWVATDGSSSNFLFDEDSQQTYGKSVATLQSEGWIVARADTNVLAPEHDAAQVQWGGGWRMPMKQELSDLNNKCDWTWATQNGVNGYIVRGRGDYASASIFLPCAGIGTGSVCNDAGSDGFYWSSVPDSYSLDAYELAFFSVDHVAVSSSWFGYSDRRSGLSVRPVQGADDTAAQLLTTTCVGESVPSSLNIVDGMRILQSGEVVPIGYSSRWGNAESCTINVDGETVKTATEDGELEWTPNGVGVYTLTHTSGDFVYIAQFTVLGEDVVTHAGTLSTNETWGADKVHLVTATVTLPSGMSLVIEPGAVVKFMPGTGIDISQYGSCTARGVVFSHVNDDTIGGDTLLDGDSAVATMGDYAITSSVIDDDLTEYRYMPPQTLTSSISSDTRLKGYRTYIVSNSVTVASGATLTLQPGTILKFNTGCSLTVNGTLDAQGTRAAPIVFTSLKDDEHGGDTNGDGDKTYAQAGDWARIYAGGTLNMKHCIIRHCNNTSDQGAIQGAGGTVTFDNSIIESSVYECVRMNSGRFTAHNSVFRDSSMGFGYYGGSGVYVYNCVVADCTIGCRASNKHFYNTVFYRCQTFLESRSSSCDHCVFFNPVGYGSQSATQVGTGGNIWGDPLFSDAANGDFRIAANSPCVDAGDGTVAPETDWWGQPRMDVKSVKDTGKPSSDGVCPDIGIYEVPGAVAVPLPDLAVVAVATSATLPLVSGDTLAVTYVVTNRGKAAMTGILHDTVNFKAHDASLGEQNIPAAEIQKAYSIVAGGFAEFTASVTVPPLKAGKWKVLVAVNADNYPYEQNLSNNSATTEDAIAVELEAMGNGTQSVTIAKGETTGFVLSELPLSGGVVRVTGAGVGQIAAYGGNGVVPTAERSRSVATVPLADGSLLVVFPVRAEGERAYLVLENGGNAAATVSVEVKKMELALYGATPERIANAGEATITITGSGLADITVVTLGGRTAKGIEVLNAAQIAATFDVDGMAAGTYGVTVEDRSRRSATLPGAVEVYAARIGPKLRAWLEMPSSVRDGRVFTGYVCYANEGDSSMTMPVFKVARRDSSTKLGLVASENMTETRLYVGGLSPTHPAGVLKAGDLARIPFYFQPFGTYRIKLTHIKDAEDLAAYPTFGGTKAYLAAMSAAATRLNLRGRTAYNIYDFVDQALWEKNGVAHAAASGYLVDAKTGEPLANVDISLVGTGDSTNLPPVTATTDEAGYFQLTNLADGEYRWLLDGGNTLAETSTNSVVVSGQADLNGLTVHATPGGKITGFVLTATGEPVAYGTVARLDESGCLIDAVESDGFGMFAFKGLSDGSYSVRAMSKDGYMVDTATNILIDAVTRTAEVGFALKRGARLGGTVTFNGAIVTNGTVQAVVADGTSYETLCATNGVYVFDGLSAGKYVVRYYTKTTLSDDVDVTLSIGDNMTFDLVAKERPLFISTRTVGFGSCEAKFIFTDPARAENVSAWAWDFDSDGVVDSTEASPMWNYTKLGTNTVTLVITEDGRQTTSVCENCVRVEQPLETILADNAILFGTNSGTLQAVSMGEGTLVLSGNPASGTLTAGMVLMGQCGEDWFCRRIVSVSQSGGKWELATENADWDDVYEQIAEAVGVEGYYSSDAPKIQSAGRPRLMASSDKDGAKVYVEGGFVASVGVDPDFRFEWVRQKRNGRSYQKWAILGSLKVSGSVGFEGTVGVKYHKTLPTIIGMSIPTGIPGVTVRSSGKVFFEADAHASGSYKASGEVTGSFQLGRQRYDKEDWKWLPPFDIAGDGTLQGDLEGSVSARVGFVPSFAVKLLETASVKVEAEAYAKFEVKASAKAPAEATLFNGVDISFSANAIDWDFGWLDVQIGAKGTIEGPRHEVAKWIAPDPDFDYTPSSGLEAPATVNFINNSKGTTIRILRTEWIAEPKEFEWDFGNGTCSIFQTAVNPTATYSSKGKYDVYLRAKGLITGPYRKKKTIKVGEKDDDDGEEEHDDDETDTGKKSCDPNEVNGPLGVGEARFVKPGDWMDYTIYFENKEGFDIADAQDVKVTNPLSEWLDWSTFTMGEVAFNNQNDNSLDGLAKGSNDIKMNGTNKYVRVTLGGSNDGEKVISETGVVHWRMRVYDPNGQFGWPNDGSGFLPSNNSTHRGEGHITYRIRVREDAPANVMITNSATIVFDYNDPIETDPSWWNTVAQVAGVKVNGEVEEGNATDLDLIVGLPYGELPMPKAWAGHTFGGWFTGPNGTGRRVTAQSLVEAGDTALYAHWLTNAYTVKFNANGGEGLMSNQAFEFDKPAALDANAFTLKGHSFAGWATNETGEAIFADCAVVSNLTDAVDGEVDLYATWTANSYLVTFDAAGGEGGWSRNMVYGAEITAPTVSLAGHTFKGWSPAVAATVPDSDVTYTAQWEVNRYAIKIDLGGGTGDSDATLTYGMLVGDISLPTRTGYAFDGWWTAAEGGERIPAGTVITGDMSIFARWIGNAYTVVFHAGYDGVATVASQAFRFDAEQALDANIFVREGHSFAGWATNETGEAIFADCAAVSNLAYVSGAVVDLYATWTVNSYTVIFDANGGSGGETRTYQHGDALGDRALPDPTRDGYTCDGWFTAVEGGTQVTAATVVTGDVTYYAHWTKTLDPVTPDPVTPDPEPATPCYEVVDADDIAEAFVAPKAVTLKGAVYDGCDVIGIVELKLGKVNAKKKTGKVSGTVTSLDGKKHKIGSKNLTGIDGESPQTVSLEVKDYGTMTVTIGGTQFAGSMGRYHVQSENVGNDWGKGTATVKVTVGDLSKFTGTVIEELLPTDGVKGSGGGKWSFEKAASVKWAKVKEGTALRYPQYADSGKGLVVGDGSNPSGMKLTYTAKKGTFKGSFKVYELQGEGAKTKLKKYTVKVTGVVVDGVGYGTATCKKPAVTWPVTVE